MVRLKATNSKRVCQAGLGLMLVCGIGCGADSAASDGSSATGDASGDSATASPGAAQSPKSGAAAKTQPGAQATGSSAANSPAQTAAAGAAAPEQDQAAQAQSMVASDDPAADPGDMANTGDMATATDGASAMPGGVHQPVRGECGLKTAFPGDDYCINPPDADKGWQLHIGPDSYDDVDPMYILKPGEERTDSFPAVSGNDKKVFFYYRQFRMRPGAHHNIISASGGAESDPAAGGFSRGDLGGRRIGTTNHLIEDNPKGGVIAPENQGVGIPLEPHSNINVSLHSINTTDQPLLRGLWVNFWYRPDEEVTEPVVEMFQAGDVGFEVGPREDTVLGPYNCTIEGDGRMLWFYGHRHANNVRFSAWRKRGDQRDLFYEGYNWEEPMVLEYSSTVMNTVPDPANMIEGGWSGVLDMKAGDVIEWECHVVNQTDQTLHFTNNTYTGEMCIMDAELVGANCGSGFGGAPGFPGF